MAFKLAIGDRVAIKVKGNYVDAESVERKFNFTLDCDRLATKELSAAIKDPALSAEAFFRLHAHNWKDQRLVLDEAGQPAPFSPEALDMLFTISGMAAVCWQSYLEQAVAQKN